MLNRSTTALDNLYVSMLDALIQVVSKWSDYQRYVSKLTNLRSSLVEKGKRAFDAKPHQFNTLIHGDLWVNNTMFTYNANNEPEKMMLVDFQYCCWTSPTIDLHYFLNTSLTNDLRTYHQDELLQFYHSELTRMLTSLQYKKHIPTLHEFHIQFMENGFFGEWFCVGLLKFRHFSHRFRFVIVVIILGLISTLLIQPLQINENCEDADLVALLGTGEKPTRYRNTVFSNPKVHENIKQWLPIFDRKGLLD